MKVKALAVVFLMFAAMAHADNATLMESSNNDQPPSGHNALRKLGRGFSNLLFGIAEVPNQVTKTTAEKGGAAGVTYGFGKGLVRWLCREVVGVYEIVTFPIPAPRYYKPVMRPEFPNEDYEP
ncbi:MAG: exosortase system-associated protein, TIGR04073 family [Verrucomicrobiota bacterium]